MVSGSGQGVWEAYRAEFPTCERVTYLNTCSLGALSRRSRAAVNTFLDLWEEHGASAWYATWLQEVAARWAADPRDAAGGGHQQGAVGVQVEAPAGCVGLEPVVPAAQAAEVVAFGGALGVRDDVVQVDPGHRLPAVGLPAGPVPLLDEPPQRGRRHVLVDS